MEIPTLIYDVLPSKKREQLVSKRNVRVIKEFLKKRNQLEIAKEEELTRLKQLRKQRSINASMYRRLERVMFLTHEQKRIDLIKATVEKSVKIEKPTVNCNNPQLKLDAENN